MRKLNIISIPLVAAALVLPSRGEDSASKNYKTSSEPSRQTQQEKNRQSTFQPGEVSESDLKQNVTDVNKASTFMKMPVQNLQNEKLGTVSDLVFDLEKGKISYAVISVGGFLGVGDKQIAVPITSLKAAPGQKHLVLNMDKNQINSAPGLAANNWPDLNAVGGSGGSEKGGSSDSSSSSTTPSASDSQGSSTATSTSNSSSSGPSSGGASSAPSSTSSSPALNTGGNSSTTSTNSNSKGSSATSSSGQSSGASSASSPGSSSNSDSSTQPDQGENKDGRSKTTTEGSK